MISDIEVVQFGRPATEALGRMVARAQAGRPLGPVTVVVPSNLAGLVARRLLGAGVGQAGATADSSTSARRGVANVGFATPVQLIDRLAADLAVGIRPLTNPVLASAVRRALAQDASPFGEIADHVATERAVVALYGELSHLSEPAIEAVRGDPWGATAVGLYERVRTQLEGIHDEDAVARAVLEEPDLTTVLGRLGHVVWHLPEPLSPAQSDVMSRLLDAAPAGVVLGVTGDEAVDRRVVAACRRAGVDVVHSDVTWQPPVADRIISVTDADEEVRAVIGSIMALLADGVAADRIGVFYPSADPYVRIVEHHLVAAGLPANGPRADTLADSVAGRTLRNALAVADERWRRDRVMALVADGPIRTADGPVPAALWERLSREAGVVAGLGDWRTKLAALARAASRRADGDGGAAAAAAIDGLATFVEELSVATAAVHGAGGWAQRCAAARELLEQLLGDDRHHQHWPEHERADLDRVHDALERLAQLDGLEPGAATTVFRRALDAELDVPRGRSGAYGTGVVYAPLASAPGHDLDAVFIVGLVEGRCPGGRRDEAMLPERVRLLGGGELQTADDVMAGEHRALLAALAAAPAGRRTMLVPRGDLRNHRQLLPSRWLLDSASALAGSTVHSIDFASLGTPIVDVVASFAAALSTGTSATSLTERDLAAAASVAADGGDAADHPAVTSVPTAARGIAAQRARRSAHFTEWDGNLAGRPIPSPARGDEALSPTRLETWAQCGFRYLLDYVLRVRDRDDPERIVVVSPLDRGNVMHSALERFLAEVLHHGAPDPATDWSPYWRARLHELGDEAFDELTARGRTGRTLLWRLQRMDLHELLDGFLDADAEQRALRRSRPVGVELPFGFGEHDPVEVDVGEGRRLRLRGRADRVDVDADGRHVVFDYKTGKGSRYAKLDDGDPTKEGTVLQLGVYAEAGRQRLGATEVSGWYWLLEAPTAATRFRGYEWTTDRRERFVDVLRTITDGIEGGTFPAVPGDWNIWRGAHEQCVYCEYDTLCPVGRGEHADAKASDPALAARRALASPDDTDSGDGGGAS